MIKKSKFWMASVCCLVALVCLTGCNGSNPLSLTPKGPVPISEALKEKRLWIEVWGNSPDLSKDMYVVSVWDFDGEGNVSVYKTDFAAMLYGDSNALKLKDFKDLSDDQIVSLVKERYAKKHEGKGEYNPTPELYELIVNTDGSGNNTSTETIKSKAVDFSIMDELRNEDQYIHLGSSASRTIYDVNYSGFKCASAKKGSYFVTACEPNFPGFELDTSKTKGIQVN